VVPRLVSECREIFRMGHPRRAGRGDSWFRAVRVCKKF